MHGHVYRHECRHRHTSVCLSGLCNPQPSLAMILFRAIPPLHSMEYSMERSTEHLMEPAGEVQLVGDPPPQPVADHRRCHQQPLPLGPVTRWSLPHRRLVLTNLHSYGLYSFGQHSYSLYSHGQQNYGQDSYGLNRYGLYTYGEHGCGLYSYGQHSYGLQPA